MLGATTVSSGGLVVKKEEEDDDGGGGERDKKALHLLTVNTKVRQSPGLDTLLGLLCQTKSIGARYPAWVQLASVYAQETLARLCPNLGWSLAVIADIIHRSYNVTDAEIRRIASLPQRSLGWHHARKGWIKIDKSSKDTSTWEIRGPLISSSVVAEILGHKAGYMRNPDRSLMEQLWALRKDFDLMGHLATQRGTAMEPTIMSMALIFLTSLVRQVMPRATVWMKEVGLQMCKNHPYQAFSPDIIINVYDPDTNTVFHGGGEMKNRAGATHTPYPEIKPEYYDQVQHTCALAGLDQYMFIVSSKDNVSVEFFDFDSKSWSRYFRSLQKFYWKYLWPSIVMKELGCLLDHDGAKSNMMPELEVTSADVLNRAKALNVDPTEDILLSSLLSPC